MAYYYIELNRLELHYWLKNNLHTMDAIVQNKCEEDFINILLEIARVFNTKIEIETEAISEGGLRRYYNIISKEEGRKAVITTAIITAIATSIIVTPITTSITKVIELAIENFFEDKNKKKQEEEKTRLEIEKLKQEIKINSIRLNENLIIKGIKNDFYKKLEQYSKVEKLSLSLKDETNEDVIAERIIDKSQFKNYQDYSRIANLRNAIVYNSQINIMDKLIEIKDEEINDALIEIVSPDFSVNSDNWKGLFKGKLISFKIKSIEFNSLVQSGSIEFKKGTIINCSIIIKYKNRRTKIYEVLSVNDVL